MTRKQMLLAATAAILAAPAAADYKLTILHTNDVHSRIEPINKYGGTCPAEDDAKGECFGGAARVATKINELRDAARAEGRDVLVLDGGDQFQGSLFYTTYKGKAAAEFMNAIGYDAMAVGNHEFDDGPEVLGAFIDAVAFPVLSANMDVTQEPALEGKVVPSVTLDLAGGTVAIVGATTSDTPEISSPGDNVTFEDSVAALTERVAALEAEGADKIIALTHIGLPADIRLAQGVPGLDAVVGGHTHTWLSSSNPDARGSYPTWADGPGGAKVPVVQAGSNTRWIGKLDLTFDDDGALKEASGDTILLDASVTPDAAIAARVTELAGPIEEIKARHVGETTAPIDGSRENCRIGECEMGNLVADAMLDRAKGQGATIAITNGGGLRASIDGGEITMGEVLTVLPFQNTLATFQLRGADVVAALENGVSQVEEGAGRFPQVAGMKFAWSPAKPAGARIEEVMIREGDGWVPIDPDETYTVVTNNYMRGGGDGYDVFAEKGMDAYDYGPGLEVVVADYLAESGPYTPYLDGRVETR